MPAELTEKPWVEIRHAYEHTGQPIEEICLAHGISSNTLRDRVRRWGWTRRRLPIPRHGPPPVPVPLAPPAPACDAGAPADAPAPEAGVTVGDGMADAAEPVAWDAATIAPRLQRAAARLLIAIEANVARLGAANLQPGEMGRCARALASLTRTFRELSGLLTLPQFVAQSADDNDDEELPKDIDEFRYALARRMDAFVEARMAKEKEAAGGEPGGA